MAEAHLDHPGEIHWFKNEGPSPVLGPCPHAECKHMGQSVIAWGPSMERYELVECGVASDPIVGECNAECRAWTDGRGRVVTPWLHVACCDLHGSNCEPPSELCCRRCPEAARGLLSNITRVTSEDAACSEDE